MSLPYPTSSRSRTAASSTNSRASSKTNNYAHRSARAIPPPQQGMRMAKMLLLLSALGMLLTCLLLPFYLMANNTNDTKNGGHHDITSLIKHLQSIDDINIGDRMRINTNVSVKDNIPPLNDKASSSNKTQEVRDNIEQPIKKDSVKKDSSTIDIKAGIPAKDNIRPPNDNDISSDKTQEIHDNIQDSLKKNSSSSSTDSDDLNTIRKQNINMKTLNNLQNLPTRPRSSAIGRGELALPIDETPALKGAQRAKIKCDINVDFLAYWNDPVGELDSNFHSPFASTSTKEKQYVTFEPDRGGWNNIRMSMEIIVVFAIATGRTLVLPPDLPLYLLDKDTEGRRQRGFGDFFPLHSDSMKENMKLNVISMEEFIEKESNNHFPFKDEEERDSVMKSANHCLYVKANEFSCFPVYDYLRRIGHTLKGSDGNMNAGNYCYIFDENIMEKSGVSLNISQSLLSETTARNIDSFCGEREKMYYVEEIRAAPIVHFPTSKKEFRMLNHFYTFLHFTDKNIDNHFKRFVRDFLHYHDEIFCAAGKIVLALQQEAFEREDYKYSLDTEGGGGYSSFHVRRGDFQFKRQKISAKEWYDNTMDIFPEPNELMYIATDERNKTFFDDMQKHYDLRYLDDYWDLANLADLDPNYMGMIDTIVASRGRVFVGTWFSTFTGYIHRMRGYHGMPSTSNFYGSLDHKFAVHEYAIPSSSHVAREWPDAWVGIDGSHSIPNDNQAPLSRGVSGLPLSETPALIGASRGKINCDVNVDQLVYWNDPQGTRDIEFKSQFIGDKSEKTKYITFEPDGGGWNNVRMNLEIIFIIAAATGRTLVLPPEYAVYLLAASQYRGFGDFFPLKTPDFQKRIPIITMEEFIQLEGNEEGQFPIPEDAREKVIRSSKACEMRAKSEISCFPVFDYLASAGLVAPFTTNTCLIFDENAFEEQSILDETQQRIKEFCNEREEELIFFNKTVQNEPLLHFKTRDMSYRILGHFYGYLMFTDTVTDNYYKRFVRDFLHYRDEVYCAAGKIVQSLQEEGTKRGFSLDAESGGGFSSLHVRRGDLQYKEVKISAEEWNANLNDTWKDNEIIYIATDERNKTFFDPIKEHHDVRFLDDYWDMADLGDLDPNYMGMIDTIIASRGRVFGGTWFSTFSGYITRMRGYHGMSMKTSYYGWIKRKNFTHKWPDLKPKAGVVYSHEWPAGWIGIDGNKIPSKSKF